MSMKKDIRKREFIDETVDDDKISVNHNDIQIQLELTELELKKEELVGIQQDRDERKKYATNIFYFLSIFVTIMLFIVLLCGFKILSLNDLVIITLISTTAANIIAIFIYVVKYLFRTK